MTTIKKLPAPQRTPPDLPDLLRSLADDAEEGKLEGVILCYIKDDEYKAALGIHDNIKAVAYSAILHRMCIDALYN